MNYIVISTSTDGIYTESMSKNTLLERIEEGYWGVDVEIFDKIPDQTELAYWPNGLVIIYGDVVVPKPIETVTKYEI